MNSKILKSGLILLAFILTAVTACKDKDALIEDASMARTFTPAGLSVRAVKDSVIFKWGQPILSAGKALKYTVELAKDSLFSEITYSKVTDTTGAVLTDAEIEINVPYFYRIKANATASIGESKYLTNGKTFKITGQQYLKVIRDFEITPNSVLLHWVMNSSTAGVDKVILTEKISSVAVSTGISTAEAAQGQKLVTNLEGGKTYTVQLFAGNKSKGLATIITPVLPVFTTTISATDNLATTIANAANGEVIGLNPGTYTLASSTPISEKSITLRSVSGNPADTKIKSREFNLIGNGAGLSLIGIDLDGAYSATANGAAVIQLYGSTATNSVAAEFGDIRIEKCILHDYLRCIVRGNYGSAANVQKAGNFTINNSIVYNIDKASTASSGYYMFSLEKLQFTSINLTKSTFYQMGEGLVNMSTALSATPAAPIITIDYCTFNAWGGNSKYLLVDANANKVLFSMTNSILANTPLWGTLNAAVSRQGTGSTMTFTNNNYFKLLAASGGAALSLATLATANNYAIDLGWDANTTNFLLPTTIPAANPIFNASTTSGAIGDPRWAY